MSQSADFLFRQSFFFTIPSAYPFLSYAIPLFLIKTSQDLIENKKKIKIIEEKIQQKMKDKEIYHEKARDAENNRLNIENQVGNSREAVQLIKD